MDRQAIRAAHIEAAGPDPTATEAVRRILRGLSRERARQGRYQAATPRTESPEAARRWGAVDIALASVMRDTMLRRSEAAALTWADVEFRSDGSGTPHRHPLEDRSGRRGGRPVPRQVRREGATAHPGPGPGLARVGMARDLVAHGVSVVAVQVAGR